ncbi:hypothetical protein C8Q80DRAFT_1269062 [Daedaleopsis nitida]|nr:hypothetical protein C8Q80DRAFT_1269062 [Daedaleopsis nitida]
MEPQADFVGRLGLGPRVLFEWFPPGPRLHTPAARRLPHFPIATCKPSHAQAQAQYSSFPGRGAPPPLAHATGDRRPETSCFKFKFKFKFRMTAIRMPVRSLYGDSLDRRSTFSRSPVGATATSLPSFKFLQPGFACPAHAPSGSNIHYSLFTTQYPIFRHRDITATCGVRRPSILLSIGHPNQAQPNLSHTVRLLPSAFCLLAMAVDGREKEAPPSPAAPSRVTHHWTDDSDEPEPVDASCSSITRSLDHEA